MLSYMLRHTSSQNFYCKQYAAACYPLCYDMQTFKIFTMSYMAQHVLPYATACEGNFRIWKKPITPNHDMPYLMLWHTCENFKKIKKTINKMKRQSNEKKSKMRRWTIRVTNSSPIQVSSLPYCWWYETLETMFILSVGEGNRKFWNFWLCLGVNLCMNI